MSDLYLKLVNTPVGKTAAQSLGLPSPAPLKRLKRVDQPFIEGDVLIGAGNGARAIATLGSIVGASPATLHHATGPETLAESAKPYEIKHGACYTCYQYGAICSNPSSKTTSPSFH